ncbi:hypothetical protein KQI65_02075 [bacterium]|nr:hypothetical protein [bacterium]
MLLRLLVLSAVVCFTACNTTNSGNTEDTVPTERLGSVHHSVYELTVLPAVLNRDTKTDITLDVKKPIEGRMLLIDGEGNILQNFREGNFDEREDTFNYTPDKGLPYGSYFMIFTDTDNYILSSQEIRLTDDVLTTLEN